MKKKEATKLEDFLKTKRDKGELKIALEVIRDFKSYESPGEWLHVPFLAWRKLEQLEEYLVFLTKDLKQ
jgi:hypothetical protein